MAIISILIGALGGFATFLVALFVCGSSFLTAVILHVVVSFAVATLLIVIKSQRNAVERLNPNKKNVGHYLTAEPSKDS